MKLLILYPAEFNCFSKFRRKLDNIISENTVDSVVCPSDFNGFCEEYFGEALSVDKSEVWGVKDITNAIIFDDGEEFIKELEVLKISSIPLRRIKIKLTRVINIKRDDSFKGVKSNDKYEYIGRGSYWGNPYSMYDEGDSREEVIRKFKYDFDYDKFLNKEKSEVYLLSGKRLGCFCKPEACHGDVLADFLNSWDDGE